MLFRKKDHVCLLPRDGRFMGEFFSFSSIFLFNSPFFLFSSILLLNYLLIFLLSTFFYISASSLYFILHSSSSLCSICPLHWPLHCFRGTWGLHSPSLLTQSLHMQSACSSNKFWFLLSWAALLISSLFQPVLRNRKK